MPNGDLNFDVQHMEKFFAPIADAVDEFAKRRNLLVTKYYHDTRDWSLSFSHPKGGHASIHLRRDDLDRLLLSSVWHVDDYDNSTRYLHWREECEVKREHRDISCALECEFQSIIAKEFGDWNQIVGGYENTWGMYSKEEFKRMARQLPIPIVDDATW